MFNECLDWQPQDFNGFFGSIIKDSNGNWIATKHYDKMVDRWFAAAGTQPERYFNNESEANWWVWGILNNKF